MFCNYKTVIISGSTRFKKEKLDVCKELILSGKIPLLLPLFEKADGLELSKEQVATVKDMFDKMMLQADEMYVVNPGGYIGYSTASEIAYFKTIMPDATIMYLEEPAVRC